MKEPDRRNPWIILGVDYGCTSSEASTAFAMKAKALRRLPDAKWDRSDLAWALNEIEAAQVAPDVAVTHYRVPADATAYVVPTESGAGLLRPTRPPVPRLLPASTDADRVVLIQGLLKAAVMQALAAPLSIDMLCPYEVDGESHR